MVAPGGRGWEFLTNLTSLSALAIRSRCDNDSGIGQARRRSADVAVARSSRIGFVVAACKYAEYVMCSAPQGSPPRMLMRKLCSQPHVRCKAGAVCGDKLRLPVMTVQMEVAISANLLLSRLAAHSQRQLPASAGGAHGGAAGPAAAAEAHEQRRRQGAGRAHRAALARPGGALAFPWLSAVRLLIRFQRSVVMHPGAHARMVACLIRPFRPFLFLDSFEMKAIRAFISGMLKPVLDASRPHLPWQRSGGVSRLLPVVISLVRGAGVADYPTPPVTASLLSMLKVIHRCSKLTAGKLCSGAGRRCGSRRRPPAC